MRLAVSAFAAVLLLAGSSSGAESCGAGTGGGSFGLAVTPSSLTFPGATGDDFDDGYQVHPTGFSVTIDVPEAKRWYLCVRTSASSLNRQGKRAADLQLFSHDANEWLPLTHVNQLIASDSSTGRITLLVPARLVLRWSDDVPDVWGPAPLQFLVTY